MNRNNYNYSKYYEIILKKDQDIHLPSILEWLNKSTQNKYSYKKTRNNIIFTFSDLDEAFKFKMRWFLI